MNILILNGSPRPNGNTVAMIDAFKDGLNQEKHQVTVLDIAKMDISGCIACEYCHGKGEGKCSQKDDMDKVYAVLKEAEMIVVASPIYYFSFTGQLHNAINRTYALGIPKKLKKSMMILSSGSDDVYEAAIYQYQKTYTEYMKLEDLGIFTAYGEKNKEPETLNELREFGKSL